MAYSSKHSSTTEHKAQGDKKKKILIIVILAVLAVIIVAALIFILVPGAESGIGKVFGGDGGYVPETQSETTIITKYYENGVLPTSGDRHDITIIYGGGANASELEGSWNLDDNTIYEFDGRGRGIMLTAVDQYTFVYSAENGKLGIDFDSDGGSDFEYTYTVNGDTLTMQRGSQTYTFTKQEP